LSFSYDFLATAVNVSANVADQWEGSLGGGVEGEVQEIGAAGDEATPRRIFWSGVSGSHP